MSLCYCFFCIIKYNALNKQLALDYHTLEMQMAIINGPKMNEKID